jgi:hypothetical protein
MKCPHCTSSMTYEKFFGPEEYFWGWRCVYCGEIVDDTILENRASQVGFGEYSINNEMKRRRCCGQN